MSLKPEDECPWKILFNKMEKLDGKMEQTITALAEIKHIKEDVSSNSSRLSQVEKVTTTVTVIFKAVLFLMSSAGVIKLIHTLSNTAS